MSYFGITLGKTVKKWPLRANLWIYCRGRFFYMLWTKLWFLTVHLQQSFTVVTYNQHNWWQWLIRSLKCMTSIKNSNLHMSSKTAEFENIFYGWGLYDAVFGNIKNTLPHNKLINAAKMPNFVFSVKSSKRFISCHFLNSLSQDCVNILKYVFIKSHN